MAGQKKQINEFKADDKQSEVPEPVTNGDGHAKRSADQSGELPGKDSPTRVQAMTDAMSMLAQFTTKDIADFTANLGKEKSKRKADQDGKLDGTISPTTVKPYALAKEDLDDVFAGVELSEDDQSRVATIFEAAVNAKAIFEIARLEEEFETRLTESVEEIRTQLTEDVNKYLSYVAEQWVEDNEVALENKLKVEMAEGFLQAIRQLAEQYSLVLPENVDVVTDLTARLEEANNRIAALVAEREDIQEENLRLQVSEAFAEATDGLVLTQVEKLRTLAEGIEYESVEEFVGKLEALKDVITEGKNAPKKENNTLNEEFVHEEEGDKKPILAPQVSGYAAAISRQLRK